ncbi:MAG TPA: hypothetical protein VFJ82_19425 [Longimicrobium sp.]|nr:hypothetical protein [Longimicrobium sp.]
MSIILGIFIAAYLERYPRPRTHPREEQGKIMSTVAIIASAVVAAVAVLRLGIDLYYRKRSRPDD